MNPTFFPIKNKVSRVAALLCPLLIIAISSGCVTQSRIPPSGPVTASLSPKLNPFIYVEDGLVLFMGVDVRAAQYVKQGDIFPLGIGLANQSKKPLTSTRESFILEADDGTQYPLVSVSEFNERYTRSRSDARLSDSFTEVLATRFSNYNFTNRQLFPTKGSGTTSPDAIELGRLFWTRFYLYFPIPETGLHNQRFKLLVRTKEVPERFVVTFFLK